LIDNKPVLLIVDDSPANIQALAQLLAGDYRIKVATNGLRCLELASEETGPDLILLDIDMPDMTGYEVCAKLKTSVNTENIPIIFITGKNKTEDEVYGFELGAIDYITKPFHPVVVEARVKTHVTLKRQNDALERMALRDNLTELYNRHYLMDIAPKKIAKAKRHRSPLSVVVVDIDHFKDVNDQYGHDFGDAVLTVFASLLENYCRKEDVVARFGGEEFVIIVDHCELDACVKKMELLCADVIALKPKGITVTASFGVTSLKDQDNTFEQLFNRADKAVYRAKIDGRNCVRKEI
jgi:diguanylate cyclase (GGDEF)-like protein